MRTKAAVLWGVGEEWSVEEVELGDPVAGEVQVQLAAAGLCHSDEHLVTGDSPIPFPAIGGHEGAGVVTKVGANVTSVREGDHVVLAFIPACGRCRQCSLGRQNLCDLGAFLMTGKSIADGTSRISARGQAAAPMCLLGAFSPYVTVHEASVVKIDKDIPLDRAALVGCGVTTGWGSSVNAAAVRPGETVVVMGVGGIGINAVQGAVAAGAKRVIGIDPVGFKRDQAIKFGATHTFASAQEARAALPELTWGLMAEKVIVTVGRIEGGHVKQAADLAGKGGTVVITGLGNVRDKDVKLSLLELTLWEKKIAGAIFGSASPRAEIPWLLDLYRNGRLKLDELITATYSLEDINQGYQDMRDGKNLRGVIRYGEQDR